MRFLALTPLAAAVFALLPVETLTPVGALPAHLAGRFEEITGCRLAPDGRYLVFDRRRHGVFSVPPARDTVDEVILIGGEPGRILRPTAFDVAPDGTFVVADAPYGHGRIQAFFATGARLGGFSLPRREMPLVVLDGLVLSGLASLAYSGSSVLMSQPSSGALVVEYALDGRTLRSFGQLRSTGQEHDRDVHLALNSGLVVANPQGGVYYVFVAGVPVFHKYTAGGELVFERHVEGPELDAYIRDLPGTWPRQRTGEGRELPIVRPAIRAGAADRDGSLWISLAEPFTYVYDRDGEKRRKVQFRATGIVAPTGLSFTQKGRIVVTPGCFVF